MRKNKASPPHLPASFPARDAEAREKMPTHWHSLKGFFNSIPASHELRNEPNSDTGHVRVYFHVMRPDRRSFLTATLGTAALAAQTTERDWSARNPIRYPDADILVLDKKFARYKINNTQIRRLHTGLMWAEGPA